MLVVRFLAGVQGLLADGILRRVGHEEPSVLVLLLIEVVRIIIARTLLQMLIKLYLLVEDGLPLMQID